MDTNKLFSELLGLHRPWTIVQVEYDQGKNIVYLYVEYADNEWVNHRTGEIFPIFDFRDEREWRHLDVMQYQTYIRCRLPRIKRSDGSVVSCPVPWGEEGERHTHQFEDRAIETLEATHNQTRTGKLLKVSYEKVNRIMHRAVSRGLERRDLEQDDIVYVHVDEKSYKKGHTYMSVLSDGVGKRVLNVEDKRTVEACKSLLAKTFSEERLQKIRAVCMDMWEPFSCAVKKSVLKPRLSMTSFMW